MKTASTVWFDSRVRTVFAWRILLAALLAIGIAGLAHGQDSLEQRQLEHKDYDVWNTMRGGQLSRDGNWVTFSIQNGAIDGEATVKIRNIKSGKEYTIERGTGVRFSYDNRFAMFRVTPDKKKVKQLRKKKTKAEDMPKTEFQILELETGEVTAIEGVRSFQTAEESGDWVALLMSDSDSGEKMTQKKSSVSETYEVTENGLRRPEKPLKLKKREELVEEEPEEEMEEEPKKKKEEKEEAEEEDDEEKEKVDKEKQNGNPLMLMNLDSGVRRTFPFVTDFEFSKDGKMLVFVTSVESDGKDEKKDDEEKSDDEDAEEEPVDGVTVIRLESMDAVSLAEGTGEYKNLTFSEDGKQLAFITNKDDYETETSTWAVYHWKVKSKEAKKIATEGDKGIPGGWWIAPNSSQLFSEDGKRLYFETAPVPEAVVKERESGSSDDDDEEEKAELDVWHWQDPQLQPMQLLQARTERNRDYRAAYVLKSKKIVQLATRQIPTVSLDPESPANIAVANSNMPYRKMTSWDLPGYQDAFLINLDTGKRERILEKVKWTSQMSPDGKYIVWFDAEKKQWFAKSTDDVEGDAVRISKGIKFPLQNELHDTPSLPRAYGSAGWLKDDAALLVYDRFDIWKLDPTGKEKPVCITGGEGRKNEITYRYQRLDREQRAIDPESPMILSAFDRTTKASGFYELAAMSAKKSDDDDADESGLRRLIMLDESVSGLSKAEDGETVIFTRNTFRMCADLWTSNLKFEKISRLSDINPQQDNYTWGSAELVHWKATDGQKIDGILYKPDGFDASKKYPMMVYFYERNSDNLHSYYSPAAGRSIINHSFYVSRGYLVFVPDIPYTTGEPGPSAANAILPGVQSLVDEGFVDKDRIGMQGHSWGGYQTAYLVTQTDMFACAESGAPVSNMTSAYGGIRWSSGMSRMFQYERTQSRIGEDLWAAREKYIANSPVFFADKVNTPLLILHNDEDGAVPWYQGIEMFVALRRLEKPAWMLNYNGNPHWVMGDQNRRDFAIRMQQFFDHYLMDAPEPEWMAVGVPAVKKGKEFGLSLLEPESEEPAVGETSEEEESTDDSGR